MDVMKPIHIDLLLHAAREVDQRGLAGAVARAEGDVERPSPGGDVEDATPAPGAEFGHQEAHQVVGPVKVDAHFVYKVLRLLVVHLGGSVRREYLGMGSPSPYCGGGGGDDAARTDTKEFAPALLINTSTRPYASSTCQTASARQENPACPATQEGTLDLHAAQALHSCSSPPRRTATLWHHGRPGP